MKPFFVPSRCLHCGEPAEGLLCRSCLARFQPPEPRGPRLCPVCGQVCLAEAGPCVDCGAHRWSFPRVEGLFGYHEAPGELLRDYKGRGMRPLASLWAATAASRLVPPGPLVPVPALRRHLWKRGWDPVVTFANQLGRQAGVPVWPVLRRRPSAAQKSLDRGGRWSNASRAYTLGSHHRVKGTPLVWLVDDVVTTGATVEVCSRLLLEAGASEVRVLCLGIH